MVGNKTAKIGNIDGSKIGLSPRKKREDISRNIKRKSKKPTIIVKNKRALFEEIVTNSSGIPKWAA